MQIASDLVELRLRLLGVRIEELACELNIDAQRREALLRAIVQRALDRAPLRVRGGDEPRLRRAKLIA